MSASWEKQQVELSHRGGLLLSVFYYPEEDIILVMERPVPSIDFTSTKEPEGVEAEAKAARQNVIHYSHQNAHSVQFFALEYNW